MILAMSVERFFNNLANFAFWGAAPVLFIVFLILFIVHLRKIKKEGARPVKAIVFGCISGYFLMVSIGEVLLMLMLAAAIAHM